MPWKYCYRRDFIPDDELIERCNALGQEGWSIVGPPRWSPGDPEDRTNGVWVCFFKRTVSNREQLKQVFSLSPEEVAP
jgi:hypothetical protein